MSHSGDSDTERTTETYIVSYKCHICGFKPTSTHEFIWWNRLLTQAISLSISQMVAITFEDCNRYFHLTCIHTSFPDEQLNEIHIEDLRDNGIHCPICEPGKTIKNY